MFSLSKSFLLEIRSSKLYNKDPEDPEDPEDPAVTNKFSKHRKTNIIVNL